MKLYVHIENVKFEQGMKIGKSLTMTGNLTIQIPIENLNVGELASIIQGRKDAEVSFSIEGNLDSK